MNKSDECKFEMIYIIAKEFLYPKIMNVNKEMNNVNP